MRHLHGVAQATQRWRAAAYGGHGGCGRQRSSGVQLHPIVVPPTFMAAVVRLRWWRLQTQDWVLQRRRRPWRLGRGGALAHRTPYGQQLPLKVYTDAVCSLSGLPSWAAGAVPKQGGAAGTCHHARRNVRGTYQSIERFSHHMRMSCKPSGNGRLTHLISALQCHSKSLRPKDLQHRQGLSTLA